MSGWWYTENDQKAGPVEEADLRQLIESGRIGPRTMLWREGAESWQRLEEIEELQALRTTVPPPLPSEVRRDPLSYPLATRWPRFFARGFDVGWEVLLVNLLATIVLGRYSATFVEWTYNPLGSKLVGLIYLPIALVLDAVLYRVFGNTPGKAMLGMTVGTLDGQRLSFAHYLGRNLRVWVSGLGCGILLITLITLGRQAMRLGQGLPASYDEDSGHRVRRKPIGWLRKTGFGLAYAFVLLLMLVLSVMEQAALEEVISSRTAQNYTWENPITHRSAMIDSRWKFSSEPGADGQPAYRFLERTEHARVVLTFERAPAPALDDYVQAFRQATATELLFSDGGRFFERGGRQAWQGSGNVLNIGTNRLEVQIVQVDDTFWRVFSLQTLPFHFTDELVAELRTALLSTVQ